MPGRQQHHPLFRKQILAQHHAGLEMVGTDGLDAHGLGLDLLRDVQEDVHHLGVELRAAPALQDGARFRFRERRAGEVPVRHVVVRIHHRQDVCAPRNLRALELVRVAGAVKALVVGADQCGHGLVVVQRHEGLRAQHRVALVAGQFFRGELAHGLAHDGVWQGHEAHVVQQPGHKDVLHFVFGQAHGHRHLACQVGAALAMPGQHAAAQFHHAGKDLDAGEVVAPQLVVGLAQLAGALLHPLLQPGVQGFQLFVLRARQGLQAVAFTLQLPALGRLAHGQPQFGLVPGLVDVAVNLPFVDGRNRGLHVGIPREQNARGGGPAGSHLGQQGGAVHARHAHVAHHHVHGVLLQHGNGFRAAARLQHLAVFGPQHALEG